MKKWKKITLFVLGIPALLFGLAALLLFFKKDELAQKFLNSYNAQIEGRIEIASTQISPFANFPYVSIDLQDFKIYEDKNTSQAFLDVNDAYIGFDVLDLLTGVFQIKSIELDDGEINIIQDENQDYNIVKAFQTEVKEDTTSTEATNYSIKKIQLENLKFNKTSLVDSLYISTHIQTATSKIKSINNQLDFKLDAETILNIKQGKENYIFKDKYAELHTKFHYNLSNPFIDFEASEIVVSSGVFSMEGDIDLENDADFDLEFRGLKENFDLFIGLAPQEVEEALRIYENQGEVFFEASIKGKSLKGSTPLVEAKFGCKNGFFDNLEENKKLSDLNFLATFTNGEAHSLATSELQIQNFSASPEAGIFKGNLRISNFESPEIDLQLDSDFDLNFLTRFFNLNDLRNLTGQVKLKMNFHDIIDLEKPELALEEFNQSYYSELEINNLNFTTDSYHLPIKDLNIKAKMEGNLTQIEQFKFNIGASDLEVKGQLTNLPSIIHQSSEEVKLNVDINSNLIDFTELTSLKGKEALFNEKLYNFTTQFKFNGNANTFQVSDTLPVGTFYVEKLFGKLENYPHELHDFFARIYIRKNEMEVIDFNGMVDDSDFHFTGKLQNYNLFLTKQPQGDAVFSFQVDSDLIRLKDVFSYGEENYVPEDYQEEVLREIAAKGNMKMHYNDSLLATDFQLDNLEGKMRIHPLKFEDFKGRLHFENEQLSFEDFQGKMGKSSFSVSGNYYLGEDKDLLTKGDRIQLKASRLDIDELTNYNEYQVKNQDSIDHDDVYNIFEVPFRNMNITASIGELNYHKYKLKNLTSSIRMQENHYVYVDDMRFEAAGGKVALTGYFNGSNPDSIYLSPDLKLQKVDLDQLLFKFDNFGQDQVVSENLHGIMTGRVQGKVLLHTDLTPYIEKSNLQIEVAVENGSLENFEPMQAMSDFFNDKNLNKVLFGSLENRLELKDGTLIIPNMLINSSLGYMQLSGKQDIDLEMDYYLRVPLKMVTQAAARKLFGSKKQDINPEQVDDIIYKDESKNTNYVNVRLKGNPDNYNITLDKNKEDKGATETFKSGDGFLFEDIQIDKFSQEKKVSSN